MNGPDDARHDQAVWRLVYSTNADNPSDYYADSIDVSADGAIRLNAGGRVIVKPSLSALVAVVWAQRDAGACCSPASAATTDAHAHDRSSSLSSLGVEALAPPAPPAWQPIETAPKEEAEEILVWDGFDVRVSWHVNGAWHTDAICAEPPTHWQPLPAPPRPEALDRETTP